MHFARKLRRLPLKVSFAQVDIVRNPHVQGTWRRDAKGVRLTSH